MGILDVFKKRNNNEENGFNLTNSLEQKEKMNLVEISNAMLMQTREELEKENTINIPISELATLGSAVSSLIPALRTVTQTSTIQTSGLYRLANEVAGDTLKKAKNGNYWGAFKTAEGTSKFAQLAQVEPLSKTTTTLMPINPATMMMAVALFSIEQKLDGIVEMEKQILSFLEEDKQSGIEGDLKTLTNIIQEYKYNWDNEQFTSSNHKLLIDIKRTANQNVSFYQKQIMNDMKSKQFLLANQAVNVVQRNLQKKFKYYRLSLYIYSLASFLETMLSGNFKEDNIIQVKSIIEKYSEEYNQAYSSSYGYLEKQASSTIESNIVRGIGSAGKALGSFIGNIPLIKEGLVDEWLIENGTHLKQTGQDMGKKAVECLEIISDAGTEEFIKRFDEMNKIYNHTTSIYFDEEKIYLVEG